jgi:ribosomal-protein-alanine N-acetyltransferase
MIRTPRLVLRPARADDLEALHKVFSDPRAMRYWSHPAHETRDLTAVVIERMIAAAQKLGTEFVLEFEGAVIGKAGMWRLGEIGYILHPEHWGKGLAREALEAVLPHAFARHPDLAEIIAEIDPRNTASASLLTRLGFHETHRAERTLEVNGEWCDSAYYALPRG